MDLYLRVLKNNNFLKLFISINMNNLSQTFANLTIVWLVYKATNEPIIIAIAGSAMTIPSLILGTFLGNLIDRTNTVKAMAFAVFVKSILFFLLSLIPINSSRISIILILLILILNSMLTPLISTSVSVLVNEIFSGEELVTGNSLLTIAFDTAYILGSMVSGILVATGYGKISFLITTILFFLTSLLILTIRVDTQKNRKPKKIFASVKEGLLFIIKDISLLNMLIITSLWNMLIWGSISVALPIYVTHVLKKSSEVYGMLNSMQSIGIIIGSLIVGAIAIKTINVHLVYCFIITQSILMCLFGLQNNWILASFLLVLAGIISAPIMIYKSTYYQRNTPKDIQGQVFTLINTIGSILYPIGGLFIGSLASFFSQEKIGYLLIVTSTILIILSLIIIVIQYQYRRK